MFCPYCGAQVPEGFIFCQKCGNNLSIVNNPPSPINNADTGNVKKYGKCLFCIERKKNIFFGIAAKYKVYIDGNLVKKLSNGEYFESILDNGIHRFYIEAFGIRTRSFEFTGDDNEIAYFFELRFITSKNPNPEKVFIVNKVKETEPGTYKG